MRALIVAVALMLGAAPALAQTPAPPSPENAIRIGADQSGQTIEAALADTLAIELQSNPSAGTYWVVTAQPDFLTEARIVVGPTTSSVRPIVGAPRWQVFVFGFSGGGSGDITLEKRARDGAVLESFSVSINVQ